ncbi:MAG: cell surface protein [Muribaculaceae bacterium]|nr:cell surface protein [Muribaculaceae bacterium]
MDKKLLLLMAAAGFLSSCSDNSEPEESGRQRGQFHILEYTPAPGQFINEGMDVTTPEEAIAWAEERIAQEKYVSLGGFGGYIIADFGHSVSNFAIKGNSFAGSNEPGIVYVMVDANSNGLPDDGVWLELPHSEEADAITDYQVTYYRPLEPNSPVKWTDNLGNQGEIAYVAAFHKQDYYYPEWIAADSYTLSGTLLPSLSVEENGRWNHKPYPWGYVDNNGSDTEKQWTEFRLDSPVDFIKVQTAVNAQAGSLGEISTEVCGFREL